MKRVLKGFWTEGLPEDFRNLLKFLGLLVAGALLWHIVMALLQNDADGRVHFLQAHKQTVVESDFSMPAVRPPEVLSDASEWEAVELPHIYHPDETQQAQGVNAGAVATDWYRFVLEGHNGVSHQEAGAQDESAADATTYLYLPRWKNNGTLAIYSDGRLVYRTNTSLVHNGFNTPLLVPLNAVEDIPTPREVLLRVQRPADEGAMLSTVWIGEYRSLFWPYELRYMLQIQGPMLGSAAFLILGIYTLLIWLRRRQDWAYLLFFCCTVVGFIRLAHYYVDGPPFDIPDDWFQWFTVNSLAWCVLSLHFLLQLMHQRFMPRLTRTIVAITVLLGAMTLPPWNALMGLVEMTPAINMLITMVALVLFVTALINTWVSRIPDSWVLTGWCSVGVLVGAQDLLLQLHWLTPEAMYWAPYSFLGSYAAFAYILFRRYSDVLGTVESLNADLQQRLEQREQELSLSHEQLRIVEQREALHRERQRLVQDMHDGMGYSLTTALHSVEQGRLSVADVSDLLRQCVDDLKLAIDSMEPVDSDVLLLLATLRFRLEPRLQSAGLALKWQVQEVPELPWLDPKNALHILRILQEALSNVVKHSAATTIWVSTREALRQDESGVTCEGIEIEIRDNGAGFDVAQALQKGGRGLLHQTSRAQAIGGQVDWWSSPTGTALVLWLPLEKVLDPV